MFLHSFGRKFTIVSSVAFELDIIWFVVYRLHRSISFYLAGYVAFLILCLALEFPSIRLILQRFDFLFSLNLILLIVVLIGRFQHSLIVVPFWMDILACILSLLTDLVRFVISFIAGMGIEGSLRFRT